jgi:hypothetical protein
LALENALRLRDPGRIRLRPRKMEGFLVCPPVEGGDARPTSQWWRLATPEGEMGLASRDRWAPGRHVGAFFAPDVH